MPPPPNLLLLLRLSSGSFKELVNREKISNKQHLPESLRQTEVRKFSNDATDVSVSADFPE